MNVTTDDLQSLVLLILGGSTALLWLRVRVQAPAPPCGERSDGWFDVDFAAVCDLPAGHGGWHERDGASWLRLTGAAAPRDPDVP